jgi:hypothetical protein
MYVEIAYQQHYQAITSWEELAAIMQLRFLHYVVLEAIPFKNTVLFLIRSFHGRKISKCIYKYKNTKYRERLTQTLVSKLIRQKYHNQVALYEFCFFFSSITFYSKLMATFLSYRVTRLINAVGNSVFCATGTV